MATLSAIRTGLKDRLATITGLRALDYMADSINPPTAIVGWPDIDFDFVLGRGADSYDIPIRLFVGRASDRASDNALEQYIAASGASSVKAVIEADKTLGGAAQTTRVKSAGGVGVFDIAAATYLGATFQVEVIA